MVEEFKFGMNVIDIISRTLIISCDNMFVVNFSFNSKSSKRTKPFDMKLHFVREKILQQQTRIEHVTTYRILVDPMTKGLEIKVSQNLVL